MQISLLRHTIILPQIQFSQKLFGLQIISHIQRETIYNTQSRKLGFFSFLKNHSKKKSRLISVYRRIKSKERRAKDGQRVYRKIEDFGVLLFNVASHQDHELIHIEYLPRRDREREKERAKYRRSAWRIYLFFFFITAQGL